MLKNVIIKEQAQVNILFIYDVDIKRNTKVPVKSMLVKK